jgi:hypothetical protein
MILQIETNEVINQEDEEGIEIFFSERIWKY